MTTRTFNLADQLEFARLSGDYNPLHVDPVAARRSMLGGAVVHGVHGLLWALDAWSRDRPIPAGIRSIRANFRTSIRLGDAVTYAAIADSAGHAQLHLLVDGSASTKIKIQWQPSPSQSANLYAVGCPPRQEPRAVAMDDAGGASGSVPLYLDAVCAARLFPHLFGTVSPLQLAELLATTRLVGMECPGLHSLYSSLDVNFHADECGNGAFSALNYNVAKLDPRYGFVMMNINSANMTGKVDAFFRPAPQSQADCGSLHEIVNRGEFAGQRALVVGGSRGLGEVAAKLLAAGGADVKLTYHQGAADARRVVDEIASSGGLAGCLPLDVLDRDSRIDELLDQWTPTHLYYLASPFIARGKASGFSGPLFEAFCNYYVLGFSRLVEQLSARGLRRVFYPSTVFIDELPPEMSEYAAAKIAGEELCRFLLNAHPGIVIHKPRLPRMFTDQTAGFVPGEKEDPVPVILEHLRSMVNDRAICQGKTMTAQTPEKPDAVEDVALKPASFRRYLATSEKPVPRTVRWLYRKRDTLSVPAPRIVVKPMLWVFLTSRFVVYFLRRVLIAEPLFKAYCTQYGKNLRTDIYIHWVQGKGDILIGDNVLVDGKCSFSFAARFVDRPVLEIGDGTGIGHDCSFTIAKRISIGRNCGLTPGCMIMDSSGHPVDANDRMADVKLNAWKPPSADDVREVVIEDNVWIGRRSIILPGVRIGKGSIISAGSIVRCQVPPYSLVAGNPAKIICRLPNAPKIEDSGPQAAAAEAGGKTSDLDLWLLCRIPAIDGQDGARNPFPRIGQQKGNRIGDVLGFSHAQRMEGFNPRLLLRTQKPATLAYIGVRTKPGATQLREFAWRKFQCHRAGHADQGGLAHGIARDRRGTDDAHHGRNKNNGAVGARIDFRP